MKFQKRFSWFFAGLILLGIGLVSISWLNQPPVPDTMASIDLVSTPTKTSTATPEAWLLPFPTQTSTATITTTQLLLPTASPTPTITSSSTPFPTRTAAPIHTASATATRPKTDTPIAKTPQPATKIPTATETAVSPVTPSASSPIVPGFHERFGVAGGSSYLMQAVDAGLPAGLFVNWHVDPTQPVRYGVRFWHTIRLGPGGVRTSKTDIDRVLTEQPGAVWVIGNEPDVYVQDGVDPQTYARYYHDTYTYIKSQDPTALVAIGSVSQPTPLRRAYLDIVLDTYQANYGTTMPIDIWTVHAFVFREEAGSWGVGIPPGMSSAGARLYEVTDHGNLDIFKQNLIDFRAWMAERGYGDRPLAVTEYGIVMPPDYGYPPEKVAAFMTQTFDFYLNAANSTGYAPDGSRLVQWWVWFSLYETDEGYNTGNLVDRATGQLTALGQVFTNYVNGR